MKWKKKKFVIITIIIEYAWTCLNKQDSKYGIVLNMAGFSMRQHYTASWVCQNALTGFWIQGFLCASVTKCPEYARTCLDWVLNTGFSMRERYTAFWICQNMPWQSFEFISGSKYARTMNMVWFWYASVTQGSKYATIWLNMSEFTITDMILNISHIMHCARTLYKLISTYWEMGIFRALSKIKDRALWKNNYSFLTIFAKHSILNLLGF